MERRCFLIRYRQNIAWSEFYKKFMKHFTQFFIDVLSLSRDHTIDFEIVTESSIAVATNVSELTTLSSFNSSFQQSPSSLSQKGTLDAEYELTESGHLNIYLIRKRCFKIYHWQ